MQPAPRTSIIMPVHGTSSSVVRSIDSVRAQTDRDFELIVIDDQSPDDADAVIRAHLEKAGDERIRYLRNAENRGPAATRNRGIAEARGAWLAYLDSDDAYTPDFLATVHAAAMDDVDVVACAHEVLYPNGASRYRLRGTSGDFSGEDAASRVLRGELTQYAWDKIFRSDAVRGRGFPVVDRAEDTAYCAAVFPHLRRIRVIPQALVLYSVNRRSITWGSVPPIEESWRYIEMLKEETGAHTGTRAQQDALAVAWVLSFLNSAQAALRLSPPDLDEHLRACREAMRWAQLVRTLRTRPIFGVAGVLLRLSPDAYRALYGAHVKKSYGL